MNKKQWLLLIIYTLMWVGFGQIKNVSWPVIIPYTIFYIVSVYHITQTKNKTVLNRDELKDFIQFLENELNELEED